MFGYTTTKSRGKQRSWILDFIIGNPIQTKGQIVKVCRHVCGPDSDGNITKQVSDTTVFINAVFTAEAIDNYNSDDDICSPPEWDQASLIVKDYNLSFNPAPCLNDCQFSLVIKKFSLLGLHNGSICKSNIHDCMEEAQVQQAVKDRWTQWINQVPLNTEDSEGGTGQLSLLLDVVMYPSQTKSPDSLKEQSPQPSTSRAPASPQAKSAQESMSEAWTRCKKKPCVENWIISQSQQEILDNIEEWRENYIPPPSSSSEEQSRSESKGSQLEEHRVKNLVECNSSPRDSCDAGGPSGDKGIRTQDEGTSLPSSSGDARCSSEELIKQKTKKTEDSKDSSKTKSSNDISNLKETSKTRDVLSSKASNTANDKCKMKDIKCPKSKRDNPETTKDSCSSQVKKAKIPDGRVGSPSPPRPDFGDAYIKFLKSADCAKPAEEINIVEVFTLDNLPTAWHTSSQESIQLTCPSPPDSDNQINSESDNSQEVTSKADSNPTDDPSPADNICETENNHPASANLNQEVVSPSDNTTTVNAGKSTPKKTTLAKQKCSTPASTQRNRLPSVFDKTIDASCIARASTSSDAMLKVSPGENVDSVLYATVEECQTSDRASCGEKTTHHEHLQKRVSFAPCAILHNKESQGGTQPFDVTDSTHSIYVDASSHLTCPDSSVHGASRPDSPDFPQSQPFSPSREDLLAEDTGTSEVETGTPSRYKHTGSYDSISVSIVSETRNTKSDSEIQNEMSFHHSTQASDDAPASRPDFFISPIRETVQIQDRVGISCSDDKILEQDSVDKSGDINSTEGHQLSVVMEMDHFDKQRVKKVVSVIGADSVKSHVESHCAQHPSFAESGSEEQIPLSGGSDNLKSSGVAQNETNVIDQGVRKLCSIEPVVVKDVQKNQQKSSLLVKGTKVLGKQKHRPQTSDEPVLTVSPPCVEKENSAKLGDDSSDKRSDLIVIEEYSTDSSGLDTKTQNSCSQQDVSNPKDKKYQTEIFSESESEYESVTEGPSTQDAIRVVMEVRRMEEEEQEVSRRRKGVSVVSSDSQDISVIMIDEENEYSSKKSKKNPEKSKIVSTMSRKLRCPKDLVGQVKETLTESQTSVVKERCESERKVELNVKGIVGNTGDRIKEAGGCNVHVDQTPELTSETRRKRHNRETFKSAAVTTATSDIITQSSTGQKGNPGTSPQTPTLAKVNANFITTRRLQLRKANKECHDDSSSKKRFKPSCSVKEQGIIQQDSEGTSQAYPVVSHLPSDRLDLSCQNHGVVGKRHKAVSPSKKQKARKKKTFVDAEEDNSQSSVSHSKETSNLVDKVKLTKSDDSGKGTHSEHKYDVEKMFAVTMKKLKIDRYSIEKANINLSKSDTSRSKHRGKKSPEEKDSLKRCSNLDSENTSPNTAEIPSDAFTDVGRSCLSSSIMEEELDSRQSRPTVQTLLDFLHVEPVEDQRLLNFRTSDEMKNKIYKIYQKPISYPNQE